MREVYKEVEDPKQRRQIEEQRETIDAKQKEIDAKTSELRAQADKLDQKNSEIEEKNRELRKIKEMMGERERMEAEMKRRLECEREVSFLKGCLVLCVFSACRQRSKAAALFRGGICVWTSRSLRTLVQRRRKASRRKSVCAGNMKMYARKRLPPTSSARKLSLVFAKSIEREDSALHFAGAGSPVAKGEGLGGAVVERERFSRTLKGEGSPAQEDKARSRPPKKERYFQRKKCISSYFGLPFSSLPGTTPSFQRCVYTPEEQLRMERDQHLRESEMITQILSSKSEEVSTLRGELRCMYAAFRRAVSEKEDIESDFIEERRGFLECLERQEKQLKLMSKLLRLFVPEEQQRVRVSFDPKCLYSRRVKLARLERGRLFRFLRFWRSALSGAKNRGSGKFLLSAKNKRLQGRSVGLA